MTSGMCNNRWKIVYAIEKEAWRTASEYGDLIHTALYRYSSHRSMEIGCVGGIIWGRMIQEMGDTSSQHTLKIWGIAGRDAAGEIPADAHHIQEPLQSILQIMDNCKENTYGVRDEYRVSGHAPRIILDNIDIKAREYLRSDPVLWILSKIWFELIR
ncbi:hypothetical protein EV424DRAFT_1349364 [Suillus variegatus]|nr:hypothetical protein EV424DRAFT_1349364 [Suillus variegatus]